MVTAQFLGKIDHNSLLVQDDYIFVKVNNTPAGEGERERGVFLNSIFYSEILECRDICVHAAAVGVQERRRRRRINFLSMIMTQSRHNINIIYGLPAHLL